MMVSAIGAEPVRNDRERRGRTTRSGDRGFAGVPTTSKLPVLVTWRSTAHSDQSCRKRDSNQWLVTFGRAVTVVGVVDPMVDSPRIGTIQEYRYVHPRGFRY